MINSDETSKEFQIQFLQLQRSALIDTQTLFRLMIDKGICTSDEIVETCRVIEQSHPDVHRIDTEIAHLRGVQVEEHPGQPQQTKSELLNQLRKLIKDLNLPNV